MPYPYQAYTVNQTLDTVDLSFKVPPGSRSRDLEVKWEAKGVSACVKHQPATIKGEFYAPIKSENSIWQLEGNTVTLHIEKRTQDIWPYIIKPGPDIDPCSKYNIANAMEEGVDDLPKNPARGFELLRQAADSGMEDAQMKVGLIFSGLNKEYPDVTPSDSQAFTYFSYAANQHGNPAALHFVATAFHQGTGVEKSPKMAETFYQKAAAQRNPVAIYNLGVLYRSGPNTADFRIDPKKALSCFQKAAELGSADACHSLGIAYFGGDTEMIGEADLYKAKTWFEKAAKLSNGELEVPEHLLMAIEAEEEEEAEKKKEELKKHKKKLNETMGLTKEVRETGKYGYTVGAVALGLVLVFGFHYLASKK
eukprot:Phypoly_transcript_11755.p1 GENE.Phypoly_transcript_11755~~Phypoly_transcript_11755.p1  ORF type:complete len:365 (+),score=65.03 Phypoly_transcript_11755:75-1169(+)